MKENLSTDYKHYNTGGANTICFNKCEHVSYIREEDIGKEIPCMICYKEGKGEYCYSLESGVKHESEFIAKCHLCGKEDTMENLTAIKSKKNKFYTSHDECIKQNGGYAIKSEYKRSANTKMQKRK